MSGRIKARWFWLSRLNNYNCRVATNGSVLPLAVTVKSIKRDPHSTFAEPEPQHVVFFLGARGWIGGHFCDFERHVVELDADRYALARPSAAFDDRQR